MTGVLPTPSTYQIKCLLTYGTLKLLSIILPLDQGFQSRRHWTLKENQNMCIALKRRVPVMVATPSQIMKYQMAGGRIIRVVKNFKNETDMLATNIIPSKCEDQYIKASLRRWCSARHAARVYSWVCINLCPAGQLTSATESGGMRGTASITHFSSYKRLKDIHRQTSATNTDVLRDENSRTDNVSIDIITSRKGKDWK